MWLCARCGETHEEAFQSCWKCGAERSGESPEAAEAPEAAAPADDLGDIEAIIASLEAAWNAADGDAFAKPFAQDADFVNVRAEHHHGRTAIAAGHTAIFRTIYAGSTNHYSVDSIRFLGTDVALAHVHATLDTPAGPMAGRINALFSMVLTRTAESWEIASFHNTQQPPAGR